MLTAEQLANRQNYIGSSDIAAICGWSKWAGVLDIYYSKTQKVENVDNAATKMGNYLEAGVLNFAEAELGVKLIRDLERVHPEVSYFGANLDGWISSTNRPVEIKTVGMVGGYKATMEAVDAWGDPPDGVVPPDYMAQVQWQMHVIGATHAHLAALFGMGIGLRMYDIERNDRLVDAMVDRAHWFWDHVQRQVPPADQAPAKRQVYARMRREEGKHVVIDDDIFRAAIEAQEEMREAKDRREQAQCALLEAMGDADRATCSLGVARYTGKTRKTLKLERYDDER